MEYEFLDTSHYEALIAALNRVADEWDNREASARKANRKVEAVIMSYFTSFSEDLIRAFEAMLETLEPENGSEPNEGKPNEGESNVDHDSQLRP